MLGKWRKRKWGGEAKTCPWGHCDNQHSLYCVCLCFGLFRVFFLCVGGVFVFYFLTVLDKITTHLTQCIQSLQNF